ncbi:MAG: acyl carrier protein [Rhodospirillaceae bacterium]
MQTDASRIRSTVRAFIFDRFYVPTPENLVDDTSLLEAGVVDSTGVQEIIGFLEEAFQVRVENDEILPENLDSVERLVRFVQRKLGEGPGVPAS